MQTTAETPHARTINIPKNGRDVVLKRDWPAGTKLRYDRHEHGCVVLVYETPDKAVVEVQLPTGDQR